MVGIFGHTLQRLESTTRSRLPTQARTRHLLTLNYGRPTDGEGLKRDKAEENEAGKGKNGRRRK